MSVSAIRHMELDMEKAWVLKAGVSTDRNGCLQSPLLDFRFPDLSTFKENSVSRKENKMWFFTERALTVKDFEGARFPRTPSTTLAYREQTLPVPDIQSLFSIGGSITTII